MVLEFNVRVVKSYGELEFQLRGSNLESTIKTFIHETNNMLFRILSSVQLLKKSDKLTDDDKKRIKIILDSTNEITEAVKDLANSYNLYDFKK